MRIPILTVTTLALVMGGPLAAQDAHFGFAINICPTTGELSQKNYSDGTRETYNAGLGAQFAVSLPVNRNTAVRFSLGGASFSGSGRDPFGYRYNLQDDLTSIGGDVQIFLADGNAQRFLGTYFVAGLSLDLERFSMSQSSDPAEYPDQTANKSRLGGVLGIGHSFRYVGRTRWTLEAAYHKTLSGTGPDEMPASDFVRASVGFAF